jgi:hypothetical protein
MSLVEFNVVDASPFARGLIGRHFSIEGGHVSKGDQTLNIFAGKLRDTKIGDVISSHVIAEIKEAHWDKLVGKLVATVFVADVPQNQSYYLLIS